MWRDGWLMGGDTRFHVRALGHGDDVAVLLHGWPEDGRAWEQVAPMLVDQGWRVVCPDLKGFGASDRPHRGHDPRTLADEISQLIANLHVRRVLLVGHDWGGAVALVTAFRHPGRVRGLVLASSPYRQLDLRRSFHIPLFNLPILPEVAFRLAPRALVDVAVRHAAVRQEAFDDDLLDHYAAGIGDDPGAWLAYYRTLSRRAVRDWAVRRVRRRLPGDSTTPNELPVPAHVVWGAEDPATPAHLATRVAFDLQASLEVIEGVGHFPHREDPLAFARSVLRFAAGLPDAGQPVLADVVDLPRRTG